MKAKERHTTRNNGAKMIVDVLFEKGMLKPGFTRNQMDSLEDLIDLTIEYSVKSWIDGHKLMESLNRKK
tara:strand:- start:5786 stop:5992 length:207 start_codon:yes stop_codon:yes gene_type:complete